VIKGDPTSKEAQYAKKIYPLRKDGNLLLCTLLLGNVAVNAMLSILIAEITSGMIGFAVSTIFIVIFGEIIPQATFSRHALYVGASTIPIVKAFIVLMYVAAKPLAMVLDRVLGEELGTVSVLFEPSFSSILYEHKINNRYTQDANSLRLSSFMDNKNCWIPMRSV
jgi:metal transporter CNNM